MDICAMTAVEITSAIREKTVSALKVTEAVLARMEAFEPVIHAFCTPTLGSSLDQHQKCVSACNFGSDSLLVQAG